MWLSTSAQQQRESKAAERLLATASASEAFDTDAQSTAAGCVKARDAEVRRSGAAVAV